MTAEQILARAAELIDTSWAQGSGLFKGMLNSDRGPYCAGIALQIAAAGQLSSAVNAAWTAFCQEIGVTHLDEIPVYNDAPGRTAIEVATALRNAKRFL